MLFSGQTTHTKIPEVGQTAPNFTLPDQNGRIHTLESFRGKWLVIYFYPKDDTPGCTKQACKFRDDLHKLAALDTNVVGISVDNTNSHADFAEKYNLPFPLLADNKAKIASKYNSSLNLGLVKFAKRNTFLIDPNGKIAKIYLSARPSHNSVKIIEDLKKLQHM